MAWNDTTLHSGEDIFCIASNAGIMTKRYRIDIIDATTHVNFLYQSPTKHEDEIKCKQTKRTEA